MLIKSVCPDGLLTPDKTVTWEKEPCKQTRKVGMYW